MPTRREFIKMMTGTVIAISLPTGLLFGKEKEVSEPNYENVEFSLTEIEILPLSPPPGWFMRGTAIPKDERISPAYFGVIIDERDSYRSDFLYKEELLKQCKDSIIQHFKLRRGG